MPGSVVRDALGVVGARLLRDHLSDRVLCAFDYDGTLAPLVSTPGRARMSEAVRTRLTALARVVPVAVVSGRGEADLRARLAGVPVAAIVGGHGAEPTPHEGRYAARVRHWLDRLEPVLGTLPNVRIEDKQHTLALHGAPGAAWEPTRRALEAAVAGLPAARLVPGHRVINIVPREAPDKGKAMRRIQREWGCPRAIFLGDDLTDETVFRLPPACGVLGIRVGMSRRSAASLFLRQQARVGPFLEWLHSTLSSREAAAGSGRRESAC